MATTAAARMQRSIASYGYWNKLFWIVFTVLGIFIIIGAIGNVFLVEILLGLVVVIIGMERLAEEVDKQAIRGDQAKIHENIDYVSTWLGDSYAFTKQFKDLHESRLHRIDARYAALSQKAEQQYRDMVRKMLELENRNAALQKTLAELEKNNKVLAKTLLKLTTKTEKLTERARKSGKKGR